VIKYRQSCRGCGNPHLTPILDLGDQFFQGSFVKDGIINPATRKTPNLIVMCDVTKFENGCGLIQTKHSVDPDILYSNYWYQSGISNTMKNHLASVVSEVLQISKFKSGVVVDIASNDNTLLRNYPPTFIKYGIDPSDIAGQQKDKDITVINDFFPSPALKKALTKKASIITSLACFYDVDDPLAFAKEIKEILTDDGIWVFEVAYWKSMLDNLAYDSIVNEHVIHYHLSPLAKIMNAAGLKIFDLQLTTTNGGSIMCFCTHVGNNAFNNNENRRRVLLQKIVEFDACLDREETYVKFRERVMAHKQQLFDLISDLVLIQKKKVHIYGASTKLNTILNFCNLGPDLIPYAAERSPEKYGAKTISGIQIISEEESKRMKPDYYLVGPYHFKQEILTREKDIISRGTKFIFPLPNIEIV